MVNEKRLIDAYALWAEAMEYADTGIEFDGEGLANFIANAPTVDAVEVVHGRFVDGLCTMCGWFGNCTDTPYYNYCPNCGATIMDGGNEYV